MTSLSRQLALLKDAPSIAQGVERDYSSLIFDKKEAATLDREQVYQIALAGLAQLKKFDASIDKYEKALFDESIVDFNRTMISTEENKFIKSSVENMLLRLAPYFHHHGCKQILEWLIYRFHIHNFDAEFLAIAFLPFHDLNSYGRLASILFLKKNDWLWLKEVTNDGSAIPFNVIVKQCLVSGGNMHLVAAIANFLSKICLTFDERTLEKNYQYFFTFFTKLIVNLFDDLANATDQLISRILPHLGMALQSKKFIFKLSGMIILSQLVMTVSLTQQTLQPMITLLLTNLGPDSFFPVMDTLVVVCQRQILETLPKTAITNLVENPSLIEYLEKRIKIADLTGLLQLIWKNCLTQKRKTELSKLLDFTTKAEKLTKNQASALLCLIMDLISNGLLEQIPDILRRNLKNVVIRFGDIFDIVSAKYSKTNGQALDGFVKQCGIQPHEIGLIEAKKQLKRKRESYIKNHGKADIKPSKEEQMKNILGSEKRKPFTGSPASILTKLNDKLWDEAVFMLESFKLPRYLDSYPQQDFEKFALQLIAQVTAENVPILPEIKSALTLMKFTADFALQIIMRHQVEPANKKSKVLNPAKNVFENETDEIYKKRLTLGLEFLNANNTYTADIKLFAMLFDLIEKFMSDEGKSEEHNYNISLIITLFLKHLRKPDAIQLISQSLRLDAIVKVVRFTYDHNVLRNALQILALLAPLIPGQVVTHIMSVFTFMGDGGILKKDNELTLSIVEESLHALFMAIIKSEQSNSATAQLRIRQRLLEVSRVFAVSLVDLPAHRRMRVLHAIANTMAPEDIWILMAAIYDNFCMKWTKSKKGDSDNVHDITLEFMGEFEPEHQLSATISLIDYMIYLGGDNQTAAERFESRNDKFDELIIFDRTQRSVQKLRHFRYLIFTFIQKFLNYRPLYEQLGVLSDDEMYRRIVVVGKKLLITITNLTDFMDGQLRQYLKVIEDDSQEARYWTALAAKTDNVADRMRCLLPANVSGHIICDLLIDSDNNKTSDVIVDGKMRDKAMQLLNTKLLAGIDGSLDSNDIHVGYLIKFATKLNEWIKPAEQKDEITLCQSAAYSLKLVAKRIPPNEGQKIFVDTMERCLKILKIWNTLDEAMVGNVLLLVSELARSQTLKSTVLYSDSVCKYCVDILNECDRRSTAVLEEIEKEREALKEIEKAEKENPTVIQQTGTRRRQRTQHSLCGKQYGEDALLLCSLTCVQRLLEYSAKFVVNCYEPLLFVINQLSAKYLDETSEQTPTPRLQTICLRLNECRTTISRQELRLLVEPFKSVASKLIKRPIALSWLAALVGKSLKLYENKNEIIMKVFEELIELFMMLFKFRKNEKRADKFEDYNNCEDYIVAAFMVFAGQMKVDVLKPIVNTFIDSVRKSLDTSESAKGNRPMSLTIFNFANQFYDNFNTLAVPYFTQLFELSINVLQGLNTAKKIEVEFYIDGRESGTLNQLRADRLIVLLLNFITKCSKNHSFFNDDLAQLSYGPVLDEIENIQVDGHEERCVLHISNCIYAIAEASVELFNRSICEYLLQKTRHSSPKIRLRTLLVFDVLVERIADELAPIIPMVTQYLSESMEDSNSKVCLQAEKIVKTMRQKFGDDVLGNEA